MWVIYKKLLACLTISGMISLINGRHNQGDNVSTVLPCAESLTTIMGWNSVDYIIDTTIFNGQDFVWTPGVVHSLFLIPTDPSEEELLHTFHQVNERRPKNIVILCSSKCLTKALKMANKFDNVADQQGYFSYTHTWVLLATKGNWQKLIFEVGILNNVVLLSRTLVLRTTTHTSWLYTAVGQNVDPQFQLVGSCILGRVQNYSLIFPNSQYGLNMRHMIISTNIWAPFVGKRYDGMTTHYSGLCIDLLESLSWILNFTYTLTEPPDGKWGSIENGSWTGLVLDLHSQRVDLVVAPLSRVTQRLEVMGFASQPFYIEEMTAVYKSPGEKDKSWQIVLPYRWEVWMAIMLAVPCASVLLWAFNTVSSRIKHSYLISPPESNRSVSGLYWLCLLDSFRAACSQGTSKLPIHQSSRTFWTFWWYFCIVITCTYSANLIAYLTVKKPSTSFNSFEELYLDAEYKYGVLGGTAQVDYFRDSNIPLFQNMWDEMVEFAGEDDDVLGISNRKHLDKVKQEKYVYFVDKTTIELETAQDCSLLSIPETLGDKYLYSIGTRKNSAFELLIGETVLKMGGVGLIEVWKQRNWPTVSKNCSSTISNLSAGLEELYGAFLIPSMVLAFATMALLGEVILFHERNKTRHND